MSKNDATESEIREMIAESGKTKVQDMMKYLERHMKKPFDIHMARHNARELAAQMRSYL